MNEVRLARMPDARRQALVQVAAAEFAASGYHEASLNRIVAACGMSKSSFYYVIDSKQDLFQFVVREIVREIAEKVIIPAPDEFSGAEFWTRLEQFYSRLVELSERDEQTLMLGRMFYGDQPDSTSDPIGGTLAAVREWVESLLAVGRSCGAIRRDLPEALQYSLILRLLQVFDEWTIRHYNEFTAAEMRALVDAQFDTVKRVLAPSRP